MINAGRLAGRFVVVMVRDAVQRIDCIIVDGMTMMKPFSRVPLASIQSQFVNTQRFTAMDPRSRKGGSNLAEKQMVRTRAIFILILEFARTTTWISIFRRN